MEARRKERGSSEHAKTRKSEATRSKIVEAARKLIREGGGTDFQMKDVAQLCNMSKGSVYYYFEDRNDLVMEVFSLSMASFTEQLEEVLQAAPDAHDGLVSACECFSSEMRSGGIVFLSMASELVQSDEGGLHIVESKFATIVNLISSAVEKGKSEGYIQEFVDSKLAALSICGTFFFAAMNDWITGSALSSDDESFRNTVRMIIRGMGTDKALAKLDTKGY